MLFDNLCYLPNLRGEECEERNEKAAWFACDGWADGDGNEVQEVWA